MIKVLIVDDELLMSSTAQELLAAMKNISVVGVADKGSTALQLVTRHSPDILLIKLPLASDAEELCVDQLLKQTDSSPILIYFPPEASHSHTQVAASDNSSQVERDDWVAALLKASKQVLEEQGKERVEPRTHLYVYSYLGIDRIPVDGVLLLQADQKYVKAYMSDSVVTINDSLVALEKEFKPLFVRIHRNALVAMDAIEGLINKDNRVVIKIRNLSVQPTVSRRRASYLRQLLPLL